MANRIFRCEFQQGWIAKVISTLENDPPNYKFGILLQVKAQSRYVAGIQKLHTAAKDRVFNSLVVRQIELVGKGGLLNVLFQSCPTRESRLSRNGKLRITKPKRSAEDFSKIGRASCRERG